MAINSSGCRHPITRAIESQGARLRKEVAKLKAERDILKKAAAYFAREVT